MILGLIMVIGLVVLASAQVDIPEDHIGTAVDTLFTGVLDAAYAVHGVLSLTPTDSITGSDLELDAAQDITTFVSGGHTYAAVTAYEDDGVQILNITDPTHITATDSITDTPSLELDAARGITIFKSGGHTYAAVTAYDDDGVQILNVTDPSNIIATDSITDGGSLELNGASSITTFVSGGHTYAAVTAYDDDGVQILNVTDPSNIIATDSITDTPSLELNGAISITTFKSGGHTYAAVAALLDNGVQILNVTNPLNIIATDSITDTDTLELDGVYGITTFKSGSNTYAAVAAHADDGVQILNVTDPLNIIATDSITDTDTLELNGASSITTFKSGGHTYAAVTANADDGVQILDVTDPSNIIATDSITDTPSLELEGAISITTFKSGGNTYAAVTAYDDDGVQIIRIDITTDTTLPADAFVTTWKTASADQSITINFVGDDMDISWGDGATETNLSGSQTHTYINAGNYTVSVTGGLTGLTLDRPDSFGRPVPELASIDQWGGISWTNMSNAFAGASNMIYNATDTPDLSLVTDMSDMFGDASSFNGNLSSWDVSSVTDMHRMFYFATSFDRPLDDWNVSSTTDMTRMFRSATSFNQTLNSWDVSSVTDMSNMFQRATSFNQTLNSWDVSKVTDMAEMFIFATSFNQPLNSWDVSSTTDMTRMFQGATAFNGDLSSWNVSKVTDMALMFIFTSSFNQPLNSWDVSSVTDMSNMFSSASSFNQTLNSWDVSSVNSMNSMFNSASDFNQPLNSWDVSSVTNMAGMFIGASSFNQPLNSWDVSSVDNMSYMFNSASSFNQPLNSWDVSSVTNMAGMFIFATAFDQNLANWYVVQDPPVLTANATFSIRAQNSYLDGLVSTYSIDDTRFVMDDKTLSLNSTNLPPAGMYPLDITALAVLGEPNADTHTRTITITVSDPPAMPFITTWRTDSANQTITIPVGGSTARYSIDWGDNSPAETDITGDSTHTYREADSYTVSISGGLERIYLDRQQPNAGRLASIEQWGDTRWTTMDAAFYGAYNMVYNATDSPDLSTVTDMSGMFDGATSFNGDLSGWDVSKVTDMGSMFSEATDFNQPLNNWDVSKVTSMNSMFNDASSFNQPLNSWNVSSVTTMFRMFNYANSFNQTLNSWDVSSVNSMSRMFNNADSFNQPLNSWDVSSVNSMSRMFNNADSFNQPLNSWNVSRVTNMDDMFNFATAFSQNLGEWYVTLDPDTIAGTGIPGVVGTISAQNQPLKNHSPTYVIVDGLDKNHFEIVPENQLNMTSSVSGKAEYSVNVTASGGSVFESGNNWRVLAVRVSGDNNADLGGLTISSGTLSPSFSSSVTAYTASVDNSVTQVTVTPTASDSLATIAVNGNTVPSGNGYIVTGLNVGEPTTVTVIVTAQDSTTKTYIITLTRATLSDNADLGSLTISSGTLSPSFSSSVTAYTASVDNSVTQVTVTPTASDSLATITVNGNGVTSGNGYIVTGLTVGTNTVTVLGIAEDITIKIYTITITRAAAALSDNADLGGLTISSGTLSPQFSSSDIAYTASVDNSVTQVTVTPTASDSSATITVNGNDVTSGTGYILIGLTVGEPTTVTVIVAAQDSTTKTYTVTLTRAAALSDTPPTFVSSKLDSETGVLTIIFSEDIDATPNTRIVPDKIHIRESGSYTGGVTLTAGELGTTADGTTISFTLNVAHLKTVAELSDPKLTIDPGAVQDTFGNLIEGTFDVSTATYVRKYSVESGNSTLTDVEFSNDGTKMFIVGGNRDDVTPYALIRAFDLTHVSPFGAAFSLSPYNPAPQSLEFSNDGTKMFVIGIARDNVTGYALSTAFDVSTATYVNAFNVRSEDHNPQGLAFSNDGTKMFVVGQINKHVYEYTLPTAFDVSTAVHVYSFPVESDVRDPFDVEFSNDGTKMFVVDRNLNKVHQYTLSTAFDVSTATFTNVVFSVSGQDPSPRGMAFSNDGTKMFVVGSHSSNVNEYALSSVYPLSVVSNMVPADDHFVTTWRTGADNETVTIPVYSGLTYYYTVIWGDGSTDTGVTGDASHTYAAAGDHQVRIYGIFLGIHLDGHADASKLASIDQWGSNQWASMASAFKGASSMKYEATDAPDLSGVTDMTRMFSGAESFDGDLSNWNVSQVTDMSSMFSSADAFDGDLSNWNVSQVTDMSSMFSSAGAFDGDISSWSVSQVTDMSSMFAGAGAFDGDISSWSVSQVTDMSYMFSSADNFNQPLNGWDVSAVTTMSNMFASATSFNQPLNDWDVSSVTDMSGMFHFAFDFNRPLNNWNVSDVTDMTGMFQFAINFDQNLGEWYVTLDPDTIADTGIPGVVGTISAQNQPLKNHSPTYVIVDGLDKNHFEIAPGNQLNMTSGVSGKAEYSVNVAASGSNVFESGNNWRLLEIKVTGQTTDTTPPVIKLEGSSLVTITVDDTYTEQGATCDDDVDADKLATVGGDTVDTSTAGQYTVTYDCTDSSNNEATQVSRTVNVQSAPDTDAPVIIITGSANIQLTVDDTYTEQGAVCDDDVDADKPATVGGDTVDTSTVGQYTVTYDCTDSSNNEATQVSRTVNVQSAPDTDAPVIIITGLTSIQLTVDETYTEQGAVCEDDVDADKAATVGGDTVDTSTVGQYTVTYDCTDSSNNEATQVSRTVNVQSAPDTDAPVIIITGLTNIQLTVDETYTELGATCEDNVDADKPATVGGDTVDTSTVGQYTVTYDCTDSSNNEATQVSRTVNVQSAPDTDAPVIIITGLTNIQLTVDETYTEQGAVCEDNVDADKAATVGGDTVDTSTVGQYTVTYDCTDSSNNEATQVSRTVNVQSAPDTDAPVIIITGLTNIQLTVDETYTEQGATCEDNVDADKAATVGGDTVDTSTVGQYTVTYDCTDSSNNEATQVSRTVNVQSAPDTTLPADAFVTTWKTASADQSITINFVGDDMNISWGDDGMTETNLSGSQTHTYINAGNYTVSVTGGLTGFHLNDAADASKLVSLDQWGNTTWTTMENAFYGADNMAYNAADSPDLSTVTDMTSMFRGASSFNGNISGWDVSSVTDMFGMFASADSFNQPLNSWDVSSVTDMFGMFYEATDFNQPLNSWNVSSVNNMDGMFLGASSFNQPLNNWDVSKVTDMRSMFYKATDFNQPLNDWDVSRVTNMDDMFYLATAFSQNLGEWYVTLDPDTIAGTGIPGVVGTISAQNQPLKNHSPTYVIVDGLDKNHFEIVPGNQLNMTSGVSGKAEYSVNVTASGGNVFESGNNWRLLEIKVTGQITDTTSPVIKLEGSSLVTITVDETYTEQGAVCDDDVDADKPATVGGDTVDTSTAGQYTVTYDCTDTAGNVATQVLRTVNVQSAPDTDAPVIIITGLTNIQLMVDETYTEQGATCEDNVDADKPATVGGDTVDTSTAGQYTVTYDCTDTAGNVATQVLRTVNVQSAPDTDAPVIIITGLTNIQLTVDETYTEQGATCEDNVDADKPATVGGDTVDTSTAGQYTVTYDCTDTSNNEATQVSRTVNVQSAPDTDAPVIIITGLTNIQLTVDETYTEEGATCEDNVDADKAATVGGDTVDTSTVGQYTVTYDCTDSSNNEATQVSRTVNVQSAPDTDAPVIIITGLTNIQLTVDETYTEEGATCEDNVDADKAATVGGDTVDTSTAGQYTVTYDCTDSSNNEATQVSRTVNVQAESDTDAPVIIITGLTNIQLTVDETYTEQGATCEDNVDADKPATVGGDTVDTSTVGQYTVTYDCTDSSNNEATQVSRTVNVQTAVTPVTTLPADAFITTWRTDSANQTITIPVGGSTARYSIDWGDNSPAETDITGDSTHTYREADSYTVSISGGLERIYLDGQQPNAGRLASIEQWGDTRWTTMDAAFYGARNMAYNAADSPDLSTVTDMSGMFGDAIAFNGDLSSWDVSKVTDMSDMFIFAYDFNGNLSSWDVSSVTNMNEMFAVATSFNGDLSSWDVSKVIDMSDMFIFAASFNGNLSSWDVSAVTDMSSMFDGATAFNGDLSSWDVSSVTDMNNMFYYDTSFNQPLNDWDVSSVTEMDGMFFYTPSFTQNLGNWYVVANATSIARADVPGVVAEISAQNDHLNGHNPTYGIGSDNDYAFFEIVNGNKINMTSVGTKSSYMVNVTASGSNVFEDGNNWRLLEIKVTGQTTDTTSPVIKLEGSSLVTITVDDTYTELGATCEDNVDADKPATVGGDTVDTSTAGQYTVTYDCTDSSNNEATQVSRTVNVQSAPDTDAPVIIITGSANIQLMVDETYTEEGATCEDNVDADKPATVGGDTVDTSTAGQYTVTYDCTDSSNNEATQVSRTVNVQSAPDTDAPVIIITGLTNIQLTVDETYTEQGATCEDNVDADKPATVGGDTVDTSTVGQYTVTYDCTDSSNNEATQVSRTVNVQSAPDTDAPVIIITGLTNIQLTVDETYTEQGATCEDNVDADKAATVGGDTVDTSTVGQYTVTYDCTDSSNNEATQVSRTVNVQSAPDTDAPVIIITGLTNIQLTVDETYTEQGATCEDNVDADKAATVGGDTVDTSTVGQYTVTYDCTDSSNNEATQVSRTVNVQSAPDTDAPVIIITGLTNIQLTVDETYTEQGATCEDNVDADKPATVGGDTVDTSTAGQYTVTYDCTDSSNNEATQVSRTVNVQSAPDTDAPVIIITGLTNIQLTVDETYTEQGATCEDNVDADKPATVGGDTVDTSTVGQYTVTYDCTDSSNNEATQVSRTVNVQSAPDTDAPVIIITGLTNIQLTVDETYTEQGATCEDNVDADKAATVGGDTVDTSTVGQYTVTYDCTDSSNNEATQVSRTVNVQTAVTPVTTLPADAFITTWRTDSANQTITIPVGGSTARYSIDWGDNSPAETDITGDSTHTYREADSYTVSISGGLERIYLDGQQPNAGRLASIEQWGDTRWTTMDAAFYGARNMAYNAADSPDLSTVTDMSGMFGDAIAFNGDLSSWDVSKVTDMSDMFIFAYDFNGNLSSWDVSSVTNMNEMFAVATSFNGDLSSWDVSKVTDMSDMFIFAASFNGNLSSWDVSAVTDMSSMFDGATAFNGDLSSWDVSSVTDMNNMFYYDTSFNQPLNDWDVSSVTEMDGMFFYTPSFTQNLGNWYVVANATSIARADVPGVVAEISAQNDHLNGHNPTYGISSDNDYAFFEIVNGNKINMTSVGTKSSYMVNVTASGSNVFEDGNNWRLLEIKVTGQTTDTTSPVIKLEGSSLVTITVDDTYTELGATCEDNVDADKPATVGGDTVDTSTAGQYTVTYDCTDSSNNEATQVSRTVNVQSAPDTDAPVIIITGSANIQLTVDETYTEEGATCEDNVDADKPATVGGDTVDTSTAGQYTVTYDCTDSSNNEATQVSRTVNVQSAPDTDAPVIIITGSANIQLTVDETYTELGATCEDNVDADKPATVGGDTVDTSTVGQYTVTYDCTDTAGNVATQVLRTVNVQSAPDTDAPVIIITGLTNIQLTVDETYTELGATCEDNVDADKPATVGGDTVDTRTAGQYTVTYDCTDSSNNEATQVSRTVNVQSAPDTDAPVIIITGSANIQLTVDETYTEQGATCEDNVDADKPATVGGDTVDTRTAGQYTVTYDCTDSSNNEATQVSRTVNVQSAPDTDAPVIIITGLTNIQLTVDETYTEQGATCEDNVDADKPATVGGDTVDTSTVGQYTVTYDCTDSSNNEATQVSRTVNVQSAPDTDAPVIIITGLTNIQLTVDDTYTEQGATCEDNVDADKPATVGGDTVDTSTVGQYTVTYDCTDSSNNEATQVSRTVNVQSAPDTDAPVIIITGSANIQLTVDDTYTEEGATCEDNVDADKPATVGGDTVDTSTVGQYTVTYDCTDTAGNVATQVLRTVNVQDAPDTTLLADAFITTWRTDSANQTITIPVGGSTARYSIDWGDNSPAETDITGDSTHTYREADSYTVSISGGLERIYLDGQQPNAGRLASIEQWGDTRWTTMDAAFYGARNMAYNAADSPDLSTVTDMSGMFGDAIAFNGDLSSWDVSKVTDMSDMFIFAYDFNGNLSSWDVSSVTNMNEMFAAATSFNGDLSSWDVSKVTDMSYMFIFATSFNGNLSSWDVSAVTDMSSMFDGTTAFNGDLSSWDVSSVTDMNNMFYYDTSFNQPLNDWDVSSVTEMDGMFFYTPSFTQNLGNWYVVANATSIARADVPGVVAEISAQNDHLNGHNPTYGISSDNDYAFFEIVNGNKINMTSVGTKSSYMVNVTASGSNVFEDGNNWRLLEIKVTG